MSELPLWRVMKDAYMAPPESATEEQCYAAEIRAIAEEVWSRGQSGEAVDYGDIFNWLCMEAYRAEAGE